MAFAVHPFLVWSIPTKDPMDSHLVVATRGPLLRGRATAFACTGLCSLASYSTTSFMRTIFVKPSHFLPFIAFLMTSLLPLSSLLPLPQASKLALLQVSQQASPRALLQASRLALLPSWPLRS